MSCHELRNTRAQEVTMLLTDRVEELEITP